MILRKPSFSLLFLAFFMHISYNKLFADYAFVCVPIADLVGQPLGTTSQHCAQSLYEKLPLCGGTINMTNSCKRMHQLLFNEVVRVIHTQNDQVEVEVPHFFYITNQDKKTPQVKYWTLKSNIMSLNDIKQLGLTTTAIPKPLNFRHPHHQQKNIVTLIMPWKDPTTGLLFSAGTRFVLAHPEKNTPGFYVVHVFDRSHNTFKISNIPQNLCMQMHGSSQTAHIKAFVHLLRKWVNLPDGFISYVWGGCSVTQLATDPSFHENQTQNNPIETFFSRSCCLSSPKSGFDCTGLIARAAQICGIPYFLKNSTTVAELLEPLQAHEQIQVGDLIWIPRHIIAISDIKKNLIIEARSYHHGYGKVQEIPLEEEFKGIKTFQQLKEAYLAQKPLERLHKNGEIVEVIETFKILKLKNVWNLQATERVSSTLHKPAVAHAPHIERPQALLLQHAIQT